MTKYNPMVGDAVSAVRTNKKLLPSIIVGPVTYLGKDFCIITCNKGTDMERSWHLLLDAWIFTKLDVDCFIEEVR